MINLKVIIASTRPARKGPAVAQWVYDTVKTNPAFQTELIDLAAVNLPFLDEPEHPRLKKYTQQHTKDWSARIDAADAFIIVTSEYNYGYPASLKNALDFLYQEWNYKPVGIVSYGGVSAGTRSVQALKHVLGALKMTPLVESVNIPFFTSHFNADGQFVPDENMRKHLEGMVHELIRWAENLKHLRAKH